MLGLIGAWKFPGCALSANFVQKIVDKGQKSTYYLPITYISPINQILFFEFFPQLHLIRAQFLKIIVSTWF